jgi:hypothetical protein
VQRLREFGKHVVGVGTQANASQRLASVCSEYKYCGTIVAAVEPATRPAATAAFDIADAEELLVRAFEQIPTETAAIGRRATGQQSPRRIAGHDPCARRRRAAPAAMATTSDSDVRASPGGLSGSNQEPECLVPALWMSECSSVEGLVSQGSAGTDATVGRRRARPLQAT